MVIYICDKSKSKKNNRQLKEYVVSKIVRQKNFILKKHQYGKPYLQEYPHIHFSISHSKNFWILAYSHKPIGIDIEALRSVKNFKDKIELFNNEEYQYLLHNQNDFFKVWCGKESYLKLLGSGLYAPLKSFSVIHNQKFKESIGSFNLIYLNLINQYEIALCTPLNINPDNIKIIEIY